MLGRVRALAAACGARRAALRATNVHSGLWLTAVRGAVSRAFATDAKAKAEEPDASAPKAPAVDPAVAAAKRAARAKKRADAKAARVAALEAVGAKPSALEPENPKKYYLGTRAAVDTERSIDRRRFNRQMHEVRVRYAAEYKEKKDAYDEEMNRRIQAMLVSKAERLREKFSRQLQARDDFAAAEKVRLKQKAARQRWAATIRVDRENAQARKRAYQREVLRTERKNGEWIENFDAQISEATFFDSHARPQGFWPHYGDTVTPWERAAQHVPEPPRAAPLS